VQSNIPSINEYLGKRSLNEEYFHYLNNQAGASEAQAPITLNSLSEIEKYFWRNKKLILYMLNFKFKFFSNIQPSESSPINYRIYPHLVSQQNKEYPSTNYFGKQHSNNQNFNNPIFNSSTQGGI